MEKFHAFGTGLLLLTLSFSPTAEAVEKFGRFFTNPAQRQRLDELRKVEPEQRIQVEEVLLIEETDEPEEVVEVDTLTVRGLVYRGEGKSTAWINESNTFEGGLSSQYINVGDIESNKVEIKIPSAEREVKLNVGESFDPVTGSYNDEVKEESKVEKASAAKTQE